MGPSYTHDVEAAEYIYGTGSYWKGSIGKAVFTIDTTDIDRDYEIEVKFSDGPKHTIREERVSDHIIRYEIKDFKPEQDGILTILMKSRAELKYLAEMKNKGKRLIGKVVVSSPKSLSIRVREGEASEITSVSIGLNTRFDPFRRPQEGEKVEIVYVEKNGVKDGYAVKVIQ